jgi:hypothetical protein
MSVPDFDRYREVMSGGEMTGADFNNYKGDGVIEAIIFGVVVVAAWELVKAIYPHIHIYWK